MFSILNNLAKKGKNSPLVCKILAVVYAFSLSFFPAFPEPRYLLERMALRNHPIQPIGLRIAFCIPRQGFAGFRTGKA
jgi:hypothetical protein